MLKNNKKKIIYTPLAERIDYSNIPLEFDEPNLLEVQINSYNRFLKTELKETFSQFFPITHEKNPRYTVILDDLKFVEAKDALSQKEAIAKNKTYENSLYVDLSLVDNETGKVDSVKKSPTGVSSGIFFGNIPKLTDKGTFIVNGVEKNVLSQIVRSPGMYVVNRSRIRTAPVKFSGDYFIEMLPSRGTTMFYYINNNILYCSLRNNSTGKGVEFPVSEILKALGFTAKEILKLFNNEKLIVDSIGKDEFGYNEDNNLSSEDVLDIFRNSEIKTIIKAKKDAANSILSNSALYTLVKEYGKANNEKYTKPENAAALGILNKIISEMTAQKIIKELSIPIRNLENSNTPLSYNSIFSNYLLTLRTYNLSSAGRYKLERKFRLSDRLYRRIIAQDITDKDGKVLFKAGQLMLENEIHALKDYLANGKIDWTSTLSFDNSSVKGNSKKIESCKIYIDNNNLDPSKTITLISPSSDSVEPTLLISDLIAIISYAIGIKYSIYESDDIEHFGNKRLRLIHEQLCQKIAIALGKLEKSIKERLSALYSRTATGENLKKLRARATVARVVNPRVIQNEIKTFFNTYSLTQFLDQVNPLADLSAKRKISAMGDGGISQSDPNLEVRDIHYSQFCRLCPIESPEGLNVGLILSLGAYTRIDENGFLISPYYKVNNGVITKEVEWLTALKEDKHIVGAFDIPRDDHGKITVATTIARLRGEEHVFPTSEVEYVYVSPKQICSISTGLIPFVEHDEGHRAEMASNMQRQAVPLLHPHAPTVGTGNEYRIGKDSLMGAISGVDGTVTYVDSSKITIDGKTTNLTKFIKTNQNTCNNQVPIVNVGDKVKANSIIADGPSMNNGELALGQNVLVSFQSWKGYNFEDAIVFSERLVQQDLFTSVCIIDIPIVIKRLPVGDQVVTRKFSNVQEEQLKYLDGDGVILVGAEVKEGDILVGIGEPKPSTELSGEDRLLQAIYGDSKIKNFNNVSYYAESGVYGTVVKVERTTENLDDDQLEIIKIYIAQRRRAQIGDKLSGRHGNKGVISIVVPVEDMPHLEDGTPIDICLNPHGIPSRMNIGQLLELHLGYANMLSVFPKFVNFVFENDAKGFSQTFGVDINKATIAIKVAKKYFDENKWDSEAAANKAFAFIDLNIILKQVGLMFEDLNVKSATPIFNGAKPQDVNEALLEVGIDPEKTHAKVTLIDGCTGEKFDNPIAVGVMYMLKLNHMVDDKLHARSIGSYSLVTQQPLGGRSQNGGQRCGEMEVWAFEAYGAAYNLRELMTVKSDDVTGRHNLYHSIIYNNDFTEPRIPDAFKLVTKDLQGLGLKLTVKTEQGNEYDFNDYSASIFDKNNNNEQPSLVSSSASSSYNSTNTTSDSQDKGGNK